MFIALWVIQILVQCGWSIYCSMYTPHNIILTIVNVYLVISSIMLFLTDNDDEVMLRHLYWAFWIYPAAITISGMASGFYAIELAPFQQISATPFKLPIEGTPTIYEHVLANYYISWAIAPFFKLMRWLNCFEWEDWWRKIR